MTYSLRYKTEIKLSRLHKYLFQPLFIVRVPQFHNFVMIISKRPISLIRNVLQRLSDITLGGNDLTDIMLNFYDDNDLDQPLFL